ncbi:MAG: hypothetical protein U1A72_13380, partial [Sulfuritalea sp.]|nr:hypothetical protein [Sulfuritalea sp.]
IANIEGKISDLARLGFADPVKMITSLPAILGYAIANIEGKISDLARLGFADPVKMITSLPAILGCSAERLALAAGIVARFDAVKPYMLGAICRKRRAVIETVAVATPKTWAEASRISRREYAKLDR